MPEVTVRVNPNKTISQLAELLNNLPRIVAQALSVPGTEGELNPEEIEVIYETAGPYDVNVKDLSIRIFAHSYPERIANKDERRTQIEMKVKEFLEPGLSCYVWLLPISNGSFGEFRT